MGMDLSQAVSKQLRATTAVTALVGTRIYPMAIPQGASLPAVVYSQVVRVPVHAMVVDPKVEMFRVQISSYSTSYSGAKALSKQTRLALRDYQTLKSGLFGDATSGVDVQRIFFDNEVDLFSIDPGTINNTYHIAQDFLIWAST